jgi:hypothetical protein
MEESHATPAAQHFLHSVTRQLQPLGLMASQHKSQPAAKCQSLVGPPPILNTVEVMDQVGHDPIL